MLKYELPGVGLAGGLAELVHQSTFVVKVLSKLSKLSNWFSKVDDLALNFPPLILGKKRRGKKDNDQVVDLLNGMLTRTDCAGRVGEVFDLSGRFVPITAGFKVDLSELCDLGLDWGDTVPTELRSMWKNNFETIAKLGDIPFRRVIVPEDAENLEMETIEMGDASEVLACSALYVRIKRKNGAYHCQLLFV